jgi:hypothetical protein
MIFFFFFYFCYKLFTVRPRTGADFYIAALGMNAICNRHCVSFIFSKIFSNLLWYEFS